MSEGQTWPSRPGIHVHPSSLLGCHRAGSHLQLGGEDPRPPVVAENAALQGRGQRRPPRPVPGPRPHLCASPAAWSEASISVTGSQSDSRRLGHALLLRSKSRGPGHTPGAGKAGCGDQIAARGPSSEPVTGRTCSARSSRSWPCSQGTRRPGGTGRPPAHGECVLRVGYDGSSRFMAF